MNLLWCSSGMERIFDLKLGVRVMTVIEGNAEMFFNALNEGMNRAYWVKVLFHM